jgi:predicted RNase H-like HicB family nuclease
MQYQVFIQSRSDKKFIASIVGIPNCIVEGDTKEEAITRVKGALEQQLKNGELITIDMDISRSKQEIDPWIEHMGIFADDPTFDDFQAEMAAYRQQVDSLEAEK